MQIVHSLGDIPLRAAYTLIKAISKKKEAVINKQRPRFIEGAQAKGLDKKAAEELFELILKFAGYGFNKSHSTGYAIIAYQTAYLKTYFPAHYMAAVLTYESQAQKVADWIVYLDDCRRTLYPDHTDEKPHIGIEVSPPDVNLSEYDFSVVYEEGEPRDNVHGHIRFGLNAIKGTGSGAIRAIVDERREQGKYESLYDFCERLPLEKVNKATIEALVTCGAFDSMHGIGKRAAMVAAIESAVGAAAQVHADKGAGQMNFFGAFEEVAPETKPEPRLPDVPAWDQKLMLQKEKELLGFYLSAHPLDQHRQSIAAFCNADTRTVKQLSQGSLVYIGGQVTRVRNIVTKNNDKMAIITFEDLQGQIDCVLFPRTYGRCGEYVAPDRIIVLHGQVDLSRGDCQIIVEDAFPVEQAERRLAAQIEITVDAGRLAQSDDLLYHLKGTMQTIDDREEYDARVPLLINVLTEGKTVSLHAPGFKLAATPALRHRVADLLGEGSYRVRGGQPIGVAQERRFGRNGNGRRNGNGG